MKTPFCRWKTFQLTELMIQKFPSENCRSTVGAIFFEVTQLVTLKFTCSKSYFSVVYFKNTKPKQVLQNVPVLFQRNSTIWRQEKPNIEEENMTLHLHRRWPFCHKRNILKLVSETCYFRILCLCGFVPLNFFFAFFVILNCPVTISCFEIKIGSVINCLLFVKQNLL